MTRIRAALCAHRLWLGGRSFLVCRRHPHTSGCHDNGNGTRW